MARQLFIRRGLKVDLPTLDIGELGYAIDTEELFIGSETGNVLFAKKNELVPILTDITNLKLDSHAHTNKVILDLIEEAYTTSEKIKLNSIEDEAQKNVVTSVNGKTGDVVIDFGTGGSGGTSITLRDISVGEIFSVTTGTTTTKYGNIVLNKTTESLNESVSTTFTVVLDQAPTNNQIVSLSSNNSDATLDKNSLTFTPSNYNVTQTVTVTIASDADVLNDNCVITLSSPNVPNKTVTLTIIDTTTVDPEPPVTVTSISLNKTSSTLHVGSTEQLTVIFTPSNATNQNVTWGSSDTNKATVSNGLVTAIGEGATTIMATSVDGNHVATCSYSITTSSFDGTQNAYIENEYMYVNPSTILDTDIAIRTEGEASHKYFSMTGFTNTVNLAFTFATASNASNVFNGVIPYAGEQSLASFTAGSISCPDTCYITNNNGIYIRIPITTYTSNSNSIQLALYSISQRLPILKGSANEEIVITDSIINAITSLSAITITNNMYTGFANLTTGLTPYTSIVSGVNSISGRYINTITTREMWYVNATTRLNFKIPQAKMVTCDLANVKQYLKDNRLTFWIAK